uniref:PARP catalytic domain-containing protein n=1 Tax=Alexandrium catenella TaxID=2925 RepID=A0A7S1WGW2_ALECA|eukprot:CAMPEP_0171223208 /NCGR_PEP_ID=MMETSP0790-20130122/35659_1 /TAXON_ID=2925 /ORGANISM="Alexandrium catenella, Strain OF101" /LENGTH=453 /DNA_ID=CAMNT_0011689175 /DNA_START=18 /DNA_END=1379 /DNA_ORIENTATION=-
MAAVFKFRRIWALVFPLVLLPASSRRIAVPVHLSQTSWLKPLDSRTAVNASHSWTSILAATNFLHNLTGLAQVGHVASIPKHKSATHDEHHEHDDCKGLLEAKAHELVVVGATIFLACLSIGITCFFCGRKVKPRLPRYWRSWPPNPWSDSFFREVDVTDKLRVPVQRLFDLTTRPDLMGLGMDGAWATHKGLRVLKVTRIENGRLWSRYVRNRENMKSVDKLLRYMGTEGRMAAESALKIVEEAHAERMTDRAVKSFIDSLGMDKGRNERLLFHGSPSEGSKNAAGEVLFPSRECSPTYAIEHSGFDDRLGTLKGMYGAGTYFADMASKADQYAGRYNDPGSPQGSVGEKAVIFLSRTVLGCPYVTNQSLEQLRRPPCVEGHFDLNLYWNEDVQFGKQWRDKGLPLTICDHKRFDSVVGDFMVDGKRRLYREYVVYDMQCYPEFKVEYERTN